MTDDWIPAPTPAAVERLTAAGISPLLARLLALRGVEDAPAAVRFLEPELAHLHDPMRLRGMDAAIETLHRVQQRQGVVAVVGDYDADGLTATALLVAVLRSVGCVAHPILPNRHAGGYGFQPEHARQAREAGAELVITVDCGVQGFAAAREARALGLDLIVTDHHLPGAEPPAGATVINPNQPGCTYPFPALAGAGLALKLAEALCRRCGVEVPWESLLRMASLGTIADVAPLVGENRVLASRGLRALATTPSPGLRALFREAGVVPPVTATDVGFRIGPRLNAIGRLGGAEPALELLLTRDPSRASELAVQLGRANGERQALEQVVLADCAKRFAGQPHPAILVAWDERWHRGVVGVAAGRLARELSRPVLLFAVEGDTATGSGRSVEAFDLHAFLSPWSARLRRFGGHAQAVGLSVATAELARLTADWQAAATALCPQPPASRQHYDADLSAERIDPALLADLERLEPHGAGNPQPLFRIGPLIRDAAPRGFGRDHLAISVRGPGSPRAFEVVAWRWASRPGPWNGVFEILGCVERDRYRDAPVVRLVDARAAERRNH